MVKNRLLRGLSVIVLGSILLTGCGSSEAEADTNKVSVVGSTTVAVPMEALVNTYKTVNKEATIEVQGVGSSAGVKAANEQTADIGMASRQLKDEEKDYGLVETAIAYDGIAMVVHPSNTAVTDLTMDEVRGIYEGKITNWSEVGGVDGQIVVVTREDGSGTRGAFEEMVGLLEDLNGKDVSTISEMALVQEGNGAVKAAVASKENAIGFVSLGYIDETVKPVSVNGVEATVENVLNGAYTISRPLLILTQPTANEDVTTFIDFILSDAGQEVVSENYIPVN